MISGVYVDTLQSVSGCDSIVSMIVDTVLYSTTDLELCYGTVHCLEALCMIQVECM